MKRAMGPGLRGSGVEGMRAEQRRDGALENEHGRRLIFSPHACRAELGGNGGYFDTRQADFLLIPRSDATSHRR